MDWGQVGSIIVGSIPVGAGVLIYLFRIERGIHTFMIEHEMLMGEYAKAKGIHLRDLPTRSGKHGT